MSAWTGELYENPCYRLGFSCFVVGRTRCKEVCPWQLEKSLTGPVRFPLKLYLRMIIFIGMVYIITMMPASQGGMKLERDRPLYLVSCFKFLITHMSWRTQRRMGRRRAANRREPLPAVACQERDRRRTFCPARLKIKNCGHWSSNYLIFLTPGRAKSLISFGSQCS